MKIRAETAGHSYLNSKTNCIVADSKQFWENGNLKSIIRNAMYQNKELTIPQDVKMIF